MCLHIVHADHLYKVIQPWQDFELDKNKWTVHHYLSFMHFFGPTRPLFWWLQSSMQNQAIAVFWDSLTVTATLFQENLHEA